MVVCHVCSVISRRRADARVGADDVEAAEIGDRVADELVHLVEIAHVDHAVDHPAPQRLDLFRGGLEVGLGGQRVGDRRDGGAGVKRDDARTLPGQGQGMAAALASSGPGDDRDLARQQSRHSIHSSRITEK
jgi:hypothetical protein